MDHFLEAQLIGNPISKEAAWQRLVTSMREESGVFPNNTNNSNNHRSSRSRGRFHRGSSNKSLNSREDVLGLIWIGRSTLRMVGAERDAFSIASGLTSLCNNSAARTGLASGSVPGAAGSKESSNGSNWAR